jgi:histidinol dehydrogenase
MIVKRLEDLRDEDLSWLLSREVGIDGVVQSVNDIISDVASNGDAALKKYTEKFDGAILGELRVTADEIEAAYSMVGEEFMEAISTAAMNIIEFHEAQMEKGMWMTEISPGVFAGQKVVPIESVGAYVPGGRATYPSSALMNVIPAKVAGVPRVVVCTPPKADGIVAPQTIVAADLAGADEIYKIGGVQAIAAMALGSETVPRVSKIVGPGNAYVTAAKMLLRGTVEIDFPAGPSEVLIIADKTADPGIIAADLIAQAEHDPSSIAVLVSTDELLSNLVGEQIVEMAPNSERSKIIMESLERCAILTAGTIDEAVDFSNVFAPEHLEIVVADPSSVLDGITCAGSVFLGPNTPVAAGDYASGTNHVLPTSGHARLFSGLNVDHFTKKITVQRITEEGLRNIGDTIIALAESEGLNAHAESVRMRLSLLDSLRSREA